MLSALGPALVVASAPVVMIIALSLAVSARSSTAVLGFALGRAVAIGAATLAFAAVSASLAPDAGTLRRAASILEIALAVVVFAVALWAWLRPHSPMEEPGWMRRLERFGWPSGAVLGVVIWLGNPKILVTVVITGLLLGAQPFTAALATTAVFVLVGSAPVLALATARVIVGRSKNDLFERMREWVVSNGWAVLVVVSLFIGILLVIDAVVGLRG